VDNGEDEKLPMVEGKESAQSQSNSSPVPGNSLLSKTAAIQSRSEALAAIRANNTRSLNIIDEEDIEASMMMTVPDGQRSTRGTAGIGDKISPREEPTELNHLSLTSVPLSFPTYEKSSTDVR